MSIKYRVVLSLFFIAALGICLGLFLHIGVINVILFIIGIIAFWLSLAALIFSKSTDKTIGSVLKHAIEALLNYGW